MGGPEPEPALPEGADGAPQGAEMARVAGLLEAALPARGTPLAPAVVRARNGAVSEQVTRDRFRGWLGGGLLAIGKIVTPQ